MAQRQPLVLVVENLHWCDATSEAWFASLVSRLAEAMILLLGTYRPGYQPAWVVHSAVTQIALPPLQLQDSQAVVQAVFGAVALPETRRRTVIERAAGNPFFLEELAWYAREQGSTDTPDAIPATVHAVLDARIGRLPPEEKQLLQTAAVIGTQVPFALLQMIADLSEEAMHRSLKHLQTAEFLYETRVVPELIYTFKHALTHEVAYGALLLARRRGLHVRLVEAMETLAPTRLAEQVEWLARHAFWGEVWDKAMIYSWQAGAKAFARSALREALAYFEQALVAVEHLPESQARREQTIDLRLDIRNALIALGAFGAIFDHLCAAERLAASLDDPRRLGQVSSYLSNYFCSTGDPDRAIETGQRALAIAMVSEDVALEVMATFFLGLSYLSLGDYRQAVYYHRKNVEALTGAWVHERFGEPGLPAVFSRAFLAWSLTERGEFAEGLVHGAEAVQIAETMVDQPFTMSHAYFGVSLLPLRQGDFPQAIAMLERSLGVCQAGDVQLLLPWVASFLGYAYTLSGRLAEALPLLEQAVGQCATTKNMLFYPLFVTHLGEASLLAGRFADAGQQAQYALERSRDLKQRSHEAYALRLLGAIAAQRQPPDAEAATAAYRHAMTLADELTMRPLAAHCHSGLGTLYAQTGRRAPARAELTAAIALYRVMDMTFWLPQAEAALMQADG
jgi:tetratricopeptide (TPR) repeat protein